MADTLVLVVSRNNFEHNNKPSLTASFDTGASWMSLAIEAQARNIIAHGMQGFDYEAIREALQIPESFTVEVMIAIGKPGKAENLPMEIREKEVPSNRKPLTDIISKEIFPFV
jgi:nitroreductase